MSEDIKKTHIREVYINMKKKNCEYCNKVFTVSITHPKQRFCSISCSKKTLTVEKENKIIKDYIKGYSLPKLSKKYNIGLETCRQVLIRNNIQRRGFDSNRKYNINHKCFDEINSSNSAYWLGFMVADGNVSSTDNCISMELKDVEHIEKFRSFVSSNSPIRGPRKNCYKISLYSANIKKSLSTFGVCPQKTFCTRAPDIPERFGSDFLRGCFDCDGSIGKRKDGWWNISFCGTFDMVDGFSKFISSNTDIEYKHPRKNHSIFRVLYGGSHLPRKIAKILYYRAEIYLDRKKVLVDELIGEDSR